MNLFRRQPAPALRAEDPDYYSRCFHHGPEPLDDTSWIICAECGHVWNADALVAAHNDTLEELGVDRRVSRDHPDHVEACPLCLHDF